MRKSCRRAVVCAALLAAAGAARSRADTVISQQPGNVPGDQVILFNAPGLAGAGATVQGVTNQTSTLFDFFGAAESLLTPAQGQARIEAADGGLPALTIEPHPAGSTFAALASD